MDHDTFKPMREHAFQVHVGLMQARSRGRIELADADPGTPPRILVNYLKDSMDRQVMRKGIRMIRELLNQPAFELLRGDEIFPGNDAQSDLDEHLNSSTASQWHLTGTARMGHAS